MSVDWAQLDRVIAEMTPQEKRELVERAERPVPRRRTRVNPETARRALKEVISLATAHPQREFTNRDHDQVLYGSEES